MALGLISKLEAYRLKFEGEEILVNHADYVGVAPDLDGGVDGMINYLKSEPAVAKLETNVINVTCDKVPARRVTVTFTLGGVPALAHSLAVVRGQAMWGVILIGRSAETAKMANRIFESIRLPAETAPVASGAAPVVHPP